LKTYRIDGLIDAIATFIHSLCGAKKKDLHGEHGVKNKRN